MCVQHTGQRPVTHHNTPSQKIGWLYTYRTYWNMWDHFLSANGVHQSLWTGGNFSQLIMYHYKVLVHCVLKSNSWPKTHNLRPGPLGQWVNQLIVNTWSYILWQQATYYLMILFGLRGLINIQQRLELYLKGRRVKRICQDFPGRIPFKYTYPFC